VGVGLGVNVGVADGAGVELGGSGVESGDSTRSVADSMAVGFVREAASPPHPINSDVTIRRFRAR
jgi:hypothetical protein